MKALGQVRELLPKNKARVVLGHSGGCAGCGRCGGMRNVVLDAENRAGAQIGDTVEIEVVERKYTQSILFLFVLPALAFAACTVGGYMLSSYFDIKPFDIIALVCGIIGTMLTYFALRLFAKKLDATPVAYILTVTKER